MNNDGTSKKGAIEPTDARGGLDDFESGMGGIIVFTDSDGNDSEYVRCGKIKSDGETYIVAAPADDEDMTDYGYIVLRVTFGEDGGENYEFVGDEEKVSEVLDSFADACDVKMDDVIDLAKQLGLNVEEPDGEDDN